MPRPTRVTIAADGPVLVEGPVDLHTPDGRVVHSDRFQVAVCTCRRSKSYPLCDTSHRRKVRDTPEAEVSGGDGNLSRGG